MLCWGKLIVAGHLAAIEITDALRYSLLYNSGNVKFLKRVI
jgi:hypothetical protein